MTSGIALLAFGGPESIDRIPAFVTSIIGRVPPAHVEHEVIERYRALGGRSPLPEMTRLEAALLRSELARRGREWPVYVGMLHAEPFIPDAAEEIRRDGIERLAVISMTPYRAEVSTGKYEAALADALGSEVELALPDPWHVHPGYIEALASVLAEELKAIPTKERPTGVVFSAHSLPVSDIERGDPYADQLEAAARAVVEGLGLEHWRLAYQSVSVVATDPWLGPEVEDVVDEMKGGGLRSVVVYPMGFLTDHLETLYDNDIVHREHAHRVGLSFYRPPCLNDHPLLIETLADLAESVIGD